MRIFECGRGFGEGGFRGVCIYMGWFRLMLRKEVGFLIRWSIAYF